MPEKQSCSAAKSVFAIFLTCLLVSVVAIQPAQARKFKVLHTFHGKDGANPVAVLVRDAAGNLYGTTEAGGTGKCTQEGCGTAFRLDQTGKQVWLHSFDGKNGFMPMAGLLRNARGDLFGTTAEGGDNSCFPGGYGCGTVFRLNGSTGKETVLHKFTGNPDGMFSEALLVQDKAGNLYGTTYVGGDQDLGVVFKIDKTGKETVLYNFGGGAEGCHPYPGLTLDAAGSLYGVAFDCGSGENGVVFKVDSGGNETVLHTFSGGDGANSSSVLIFDSKGNLYGTTQYGGNGECGGTGCGVVFKLSPQSGGNWSETVLYRFCSLSNCADGETPVTGPLVRDQQGNLYGTTYFGGASHNCAGAGCGAVFKLDRSGKETVLHSFTGGRDGAFPFAGLIVDGQSNLYGTTQGGGATCYTSHTCGVVFEITP
jgi:uncharacterized repeat protein (TIGR03803 family)